MAGRGAARAEDAQGTPTQSRKSPSILQNTKIKPKQAAAKTRNTKPETAWTQRHLLGSKPRQVASEPRVSNPVVPKPEQVSAEEMENAKDWDDHYSPLQPDRSTRTPKPETRIPNPEMRSPKPGT